MSLLNSYKIIYTHEYDIFRSSKHKHEAPEIFDLVQCFRETHRTKICEIEMLVFVTHLHSTHMQFLVDCQTLGCS